MVYLLLSIDFKRPWHVQWLQAASLNTWTVITISFDNDHNFKSYRVQAIYSQSIGHASNNNCQCPCVAMKHHVMYVSSCETQYVPTAHSKLLWFKQSNWKTKSSPLSKLSFQTNSHPLLKRILVLCQCQHLNIVVYSFGCCQRSLCSLPSTETAWGWKHSRDALPCHPGLPPNFSSNPFYLLYSFWSHFITEQFSR